VYLDLLTDSIFSLPSYLKAYVFSQGERSFYEDRVEGPWWVGEQDDVNYDWEEEDCYGYHANPLVRYLLVLPNEKTPFFVHSTMYVRHNPWYLIFEGCVFVVLMAVIPTAYVALYILHYPLVGSNFMRRQADILSREIRDNWSNTRTRHTDPEKVATYIVGTHKEGWKNLMKSSLFIFYFQIFFPQVSFV